MGEKSISYFPIALFSSVMGFAAVTIAIILLENTYELNQVISSLFLAITSLLFLCNIGILFGRIVRYPTSVQADFNHPVKMNFFAAISISLLLLAFAYLNIAENLSFILWILGAMMQLSLTIIFLTKLIGNGKFQMGQFTPASFIPIVGNLIVPIAGSFHVSEEINWFFFSVGVLFSIIYLTLIFHRLFFSPPLPKQLMPTLFILLAPPSVAYSAYVNITNKVDIFAHSLYGIAFFIALFLIFQLRQIFSSQFSIPFWSLLFPSGAFTIATIRMYRETGIVYYEWIFFVMFVGVLVLMTYLTWKTVQLLRKGVLFLPEK